VIVLDPSSLAITKEIAVGEHPNAMGLSKDGTRLFVACANTNAVWVVDVATGRATEQIGVALFPNAPPGTTPNALALSPDGATLLVANADNNTVAVVDVSTRDQSRVKGFIPTGWYPTSVTFDREGRRIYVLNGKGLAPAANPRGPQPGLPGSQYIAQLLQGALSEIAVPDAVELARLTRKAYEVTPYDDKTRLAPANAPVDSPIPARVGQSSPIKHVFYIVRENRTYDQVFGDIETGNGDPTLTLFGDEVTPNAHALAREFVLLDNFYVDAEVSYDGHAFSMGAYATDAVEKIWPTNYGQRGGIYLSEGGGGQRNPYGNLAAPPQGYIWDMARRTGVSVRSYGEFVDRDEQTGRSEASVPGLQGFINPDYPPYDLNIRDNTRVDVWVKEFNVFVRDGSVPGLSIIRLGNDHTAATRPSAYTPRAMIAENDAALGRVVETISKSRIWKESAIFVLEDDAQNGADHVDAHRSPALVISPFTRRRVVDSTMYSTSSVLRTMELILGLEPMTQYDASATPFYNAFTPTPTLTPYTALPPRVSINEKNGSTAWGAQASLRMNLEDADMAPENELNEILWHSIRGPHVPMPPPRHAAFVRAVATGREDERKK
jgi:YVTN family beta-propeller protein